MGKTKTIVHNINILTRSLLYGKGIFSFVYYSILRNSEWFSFNFNLLKHSF